MQSISLGICALMVAALAARPLPAQDDVADIPSQDLRAGNDENKRYFLIGPRKDAKPPAEGYGLVVFLPGGAGSADFHSFVKRIYKFALNDRYLAAQPVAVKWADDQEVVWPTEKMRVAKGMKFTTEEFVAAVLDDVAAKHKLDTAHIFVLAWSSGGPAAYEIALVNPRVTGSLIAMSVFRTEWLSPLEKAKGRSFFLYHCEQDQVCPFWMAKRAVAELARNGAQTELLTYEGGHGWRGPLYDNLRTGIEWLEKHHGDPPK